MTHYNLEKLAYKSQLIGAGIGALGGGGLGYLGATRDRNESEDAFSSRRARNALIGATLGGALGAGVGHYRGGRAAPVTASPSAPAAAAAAPTPTVVGTNVTPSASRAVTQKLPDTLTIPPMPPGPLPDAAPRIPLAAPVSRAPSAPQTSGARASTAARTAAPAAAPAAAPSVESGPMIGSQIGAAPQRAPTTPAPRAEAAPAAAPPRRLAKVERGDGLEVHDVSNYNWPASDRGVGALENSPIMDTWARETFGLPNLAAVREHLRANNINPRDLSLGKVTLDGKIVRNPHFDIDDIYSVKKLNTHAKDYIRRGTRKQT